MAYSAEWMITSSFLAKHIFWCNFKKNVIPVQQCANNIFWCKICSTWNSELCYYFVEKRQNLQQIVKIGIFFMAYLLIVHFFYINMQLFLQKLTKFATNCLNMNNGRGKFPVFISAYTGRVQRSWNHLGTTLELSIFFQSYSQLSFQNSVSKKKLFKSRFKLINVEFTLLSLTETKKNNLKRLKSNYKDTRYSYK